MNAVANAKIEPASRIVRSEAVVSAELVDTVVVADFEKGRYYELNPVGAGIWARIQSGVRIAEVCEAVVAEYEVAPRACYEEVYAFLAELLRLEVVRVEQLPGDPPHEAITGPDGQVAPGPCDNGTRRGQRTAWSPPAVRVMQIGTVTASGNLTFTYEAKFGDYEHYVRS